MSTTEVSEYMTNRKFKAGAYRALVGFGLLLLILVMWSRIFITIPAGHSGVFFDRFKGTQIDKVWRRYLYNFTLELFDIL